MVKAHPDQMPLWGAWTNEPVRHDGLHAFTHIIRHPNDPERMPRGTHNDPNERWRKLTGKGTEPRWYDEILAHLQDGVPRTFNRIMVELADITADVAFKKAPDRALWQLVADKRIEHTMSAPTLFRCVVSPEGAEAIPPTPVTEAPHGAERKEEDNGFV